MATSTTDGPQAGGALEERRHEETARDEEDGHDHDPLPPEILRGEMKEDQALEEDRHDNELTVVEALGSRGRSTDL